MSHAEYRVEIPTTDELGNLLHPELPRAAHNWLHGALKEGASSRIEGPHTHHWGESAPRGFHHLVAVAHDRPETDGIVKQLGSHLAGLLNIPTVSITKTGQNGPEPWMITNPDHSPGYSATTSALSPTTALSGALSAFAYDSRVNPRPTLSDA